MQSPSYSEYMMVRRIPRKHHDGQWTVSYPMATALNELFYVTTCSTEEEAAQTFNNVCKHLGRFWYALHCCESPATVFILFYFYRGWNTIHGVCEAHPIQDPEILARLAPYVGA